MSQKTHSSRITAFKNASKGAQELRRKRAEASVALRRAARDDQLQKRRALSPPAGGLDANEDASGTPEKLPAPAEIVAGLQSTDAATLIVAARAARRTLSREQNPPIALMVAAGCVAPLVAALDRDDCPELQFEAAWALTNIASGTHEDTMSVIDAHAIPKLVRLLPYGGQLGEQAAWAVGNIAGDGAEARDAALAAGALGALLPVLGSESSGTSNSALRTGVWTLSNLCRNKNPLVSFEKVAPALPCLAHLLLSADQDVLADACWALSYLTDGPNSRIESVQQTRGLLANLVPLLSHDAPAVRTPALRAVGNMVTGTDQQTDRVLDTSALQHINALLRCSKASLVKEAAWAISNVMAGSQPQIQRCIDAGVLPHLVYVIREGEPRCQKEAAWAITNMSLGGNVVQLGALLAEGFLGPYCALLASPDPRTLTVVLEGITNLLQAAEKCGETESLCLRLEEEGALDKLESLQQHENEQIYQKTLHILDTYFSDGTVEDQQAPTSNGEEFAFGTTNQEVGKF